MTLTPSFIPSLSTSHINYDRRGIHHVLGVGNGLTDDGDFAILGINVSLDDNNNVDDEKIMDMHNYNSKNDFNTGTLIGSGGVGTMLFNEHLQRSGRVDLGVGATNKYRDFRGNEIVKKDGHPIVKEWLLELLPNLDIYDVESYAEGLSNIGFDPNCKSQCELQYDDLDFMRVLHRRYLYKEIMGEGHPFEP
jgi:hypothetical protein